MHDSDWPWPEDLDALRAAPDSHALLLENDAVRVVEVVIEPGVREPMHTHRWPSVMIVVGGARIRYYGKDGELEFESSEAGTEEAGTEAPPGAPRTEWLGPEGPHAVENVDSTSYRAYRIELKSA